MNRNRGVCTKGLIKKLLLGLCACLVLLTLRFEYKYMANKLPTDIDLVVDDHRMDVPQAAHLVHGFMEKSGMPPDLQLLPNMAEVRVLKYFNWLREYLQTSKVAHPPVALGENSGEGCQVLVNHQYKFIWLKGYKVGSTSARASLGNICGDSWKAPKNASFEFCSSRLVQDYDGSVNYNSEVAEHEASELAQVWKDYFVFAFVRNPFTRFASAFEFANRRIPKGCSEVKFEESCINPYQHVLACERCCPGEMYFHAAHFTNQSTCLFTKDWTPAVDYIGHSETLEEDLLRVISEINSRKSTGIPELQVVDIHSNGNRPRSGLADEEKYSDLYTKWDGCIPAVVRNYEQDFKLLGFNKTFHASE